jgi:hypothetical protein
LDEPSADNECLYIWAAWTISDVGRTVRWSFEVRGGKFIRSESGLSQFELPYDCFWKGLVMSGALCRWWWSDFVAMAVINI